MAHERGSEGNDDIRNDIGHADIADIGNPIQQVALLNGNKMVYVIVLYVFGGNLYSVRIDIDGQDMTGTEKGGTDGKDSAAGTHIDDLFSAFDNLLQQGKTHTGGFMGSAAEGHARINFNDQVIGPGIKRLPGGFDQKMLTGIEGFVILLPGILPGFIIDGNRIQEKGPHFILGEGKFRQPVPDLFHQGRKLRVVLKPGMDKNVLRHGFQEFRINDLPDTVRLGRIRYIRLILNHCSGSAGFHQDIRNRF